MFLNSIGNHLVTNGNFVVARQWSLGLEGAPESVPRRVSPKTGECPTGCPTESVPGVSKKGVPDTPLDTRDSL